MTREEFDRQVKRALEFYEKAGIILSEDEKKASRFVTME